MKTMMKTMMTAATLVVALAGGAGAQSSFKVGPIEVADAWARASAGRAAAGAAYFEVRNHGAQADRLVSATTKVARKASLHAHVMTGDIMRMEPVDGLDVPAGGAVILKPGGHHMMLMGLARPLMRGRSFALTLTFEKAGSVTVMVVIRAPGARGPRGHKRGHRRNTEGR